MQGGSADRFIQNGNGNTQIIKLELSDPYLEFELEQDDERTTPTGGSESRDERLDLTPSLGLGLDGFIYHPYFLSFDMNLEQGVTWGERVITTEDGKRTEERDFELGRYFASVQLFSEKPGSLTLRASETQNRQDFDRFRTITYDSTAYGARFNYRSQTLPWFVTYDNHVDDVIDQDRPTYREEDRMTAQFTNKREGNDKTQLKLTYIDTFRQEQDLEPYEGTSLAADLTDQEYWGADDEIRLLSGLRFDGQDNNYVESTSILLEQQLDIQHRENLSSDYEYGLEERDNQDSDVSWYTAEAGVNHRLFESLTSRGLVEAESYESTGIDFSSDFTRIGPGFEETYTKKLPAESRVTIDLSGKFYQEDLTSAGNTISIVNEKHRIVDGRPAILDFPNVTPGSVRVKSADSSQVFIEGLDYRVIQAGNFTEVQRIFAGEIPNGSTVLVDYSAEGDQSARTRSRDIDSGFELEWLDGLLTFYADYRNRAYDSTEAARFENYQSRGMGLKSAYRIFEVGVDTSYVDSDSTTYEQLRYYQRINYRPVDDVFLGFEASQGTTDYSNPEQTQEINSYYAIVQYNPVNMLSLSLQGGRYEEVGLGFDRLLDTAEFRVDVFLGKLTLYTSYRHETEELIGSDKQRDLLYLKARRDF